MDRHSFEFALRMKPSGCLRHRWRNCLIKMSEPNEYLKIIFIEDGLKETSTSRKFRIVCKEDKRSVERVGFCNVWKMHNRAYGKGVNDRAVCQAQKKIWSG